MGCSGLLWDVPGVFRGCSGLFRAVPGCSGGVPGVFWGVPGVFRGVPGVFRGVPGCSGVFRVCSGFYRHPTMYVIDMKQRAGFFFHDSQFFLYPLEILKLLFFSISESFCMSEG